MNKGQYNCDLHQDIEMMTFDDSSFDAVICLEVLEHVANPFQAVHEIKRVLINGGKLLLTVPFLSQYHGKSALSHDHLNYPDYWRFTHEGLHKLFHDFTNLEVLPLDGPIEFRLKQFYLTRWINYPAIRRIIDLIDKPERGKATTRHLVYGIK
ncbi:MAG: class I SAM-dependent methyltransferase [Gammaproteobacteria bacterium]|nr:class I SAM-dependent methyltransferase [Gammaproteobacteria bacterium]